MCWQYGDTWSLECEGKAVSDFVSKSSANNLSQGQRTRTIHIPVSAGNPSLGLSLQWTSLSTVSNIWHILDVPANSPADLAGLLPYSDYILGTPEGVLHGESGLGELVEDHIGRPLRLYVYNNEYDVTREITIHPSRDWGGEGALGCVLGYGALHRLPAPLSEPVAGPGAPPTGVPGRKKDRKHGHGHSPNKNFMDDYFMEGEKKSRELDHPPSAKSTPPPPPPKAGDPPKSGGPPKAAALEGTEDAEDGGVD